MKFPKPASKKTSKTSKPAAKAAKPAPKAKAPKAEKKAKRTRADVDWVAAGRKAWETRVKNGNAVPSAKPKKARKARTSPVPILDVQPTAAMSAAVDAQPVTH